MEKALQDRLVVVVKVSVIVPYTQMSDTDKYYINLILNDKFEQFYEAFSDSPKNSFLQNIFSLKNNRRKTHKIITFLGCKLKIRRNIRV